MAKLSLQDNWTLLGLLCTALAMTPPLHIPVALDVDYSNSLSVAEFARATNSHLNVAQDVFNQFDANKDGLLQPHELIADVTFQQPSAMQIIGAISTAILIAVPMLITFINMVYVKNPNLPLDDENTGYMGTSMFFSMVFAVYMWYDKGIGIAITLHLLQACTLAFARARLCSSVRISYLALDS